MTDIFHLNITSDSIFNLANLIPVAESGAVLADINYPNLLFEHSWIHVVLLLIFVLINGFFVASEVALIKLRSSQLDKHDPKYAEYAAVTRKILEHLDRYITACKFGASVSGILLGAVFVPFLVGKLVPQDKSNGYLIQKLGFRSESVDLILAFLIALCISICLLVVFGKVIPNSIGFRRELQVSLRCSKPLHLFYNVFGLPIILLTKFSNWFMEAVLKIEPASEREIEHSAEDLKIFVEETGDDAVTETERDILINALELNDLKVLDIVTPRSEVIALDINDPFEKSLEKAVQSKHTRFPLIDEHLDDTLGWVHIKDLIQLLQEENPRLDRVKRTILRVPEDMELDKLLRTLLNEKANIALVNDEFGGAQGIVMRDQILKLLVVGTAEEADDNENEEEIKFEKISDDEFLVAASMPLHELDDLVPELDLESIDVRTVGGYVTSVLGHHPEVGETAEIEGFLMKVVAANERKILSLRFNRILSETNIAAS
ncbi:MAG: hemolysin family protein [Verrucomicrobiales bacterium]|nr:hemolysin family protein [Verrucomicrobiales bacterium]